MYYEINEDLARSAKQMWSMSEYIMGSATESYKSMVDNVTVTGERAKKRVSEDKYAYIDYLVDKYARLYAQYINKGNSIQMMCPSILISGGSNFPVRRKEKQNRACENNYKYYQEKILSIIDKLNSVGTASAIIKSNDPLAIELLQDKLEKLELKQQHMKNVNAYYRKHKTLEGYKNPEDETEDGVLNVSAPYPSFALTNNNAKIKSTRDRITLLTRTIEKGTETVEFDFCKVVANVEAMRLQLFFDKKPSAEVRSMLSKNGFKWSPTNEAWQRQLTNNAKFTWNHYVLPALKEAYSK